MISDCRSGKIDMIITKSVSRFARNVVDCISMVRMLAELPSPVGVFFESECIFSLKDDSQMALSFQATMAQEESHIRSRSMETSLRMRLDGGLPLTPKLLGYSHDAEGNLVVNPDEAPTVKLIFYMYLYGYSTADIAAALTELGRKTYLGNIKWTSNSIVQVLRNERHCGDVLTRKTFTPNYLNHKARKNRGDRPQSLYRNHHEGIISRDDFIAVQHLLNNSKYGNRSILPELRVIDSGLLKGFVVINPRWAGFKPADYYQASISIQVTAEQREETDPAKSITLSPGDFDMRGFEIARSEFFDNHLRPYVLFQDKKVKFTVYSDGENCWFSTSPCEDWTPGSQTAPDTPIATAPPQSALNVLNTHTKKFHYPDCPSVEQMSDKNKDFADATREELIGRGYTPCGRCDP